MRVAYDHARLADVCRRWKVVRFELHGSVVRDDFDPATSDVDCLVTFEAGYRPRLLELGGLQQALEYVFGRRVDVHIRQSIEAMENRRIREAILGGAVDVAI